MAFVSAVGLALLVACATPPIMVVPAKTTLARDHVELPTSTAPNDASLFVEAMINGRGPFRLLVDTGASGLVLFPRPAEAAGLTPASGITKEAVGASGAARMSQVARVDLLQSGDFRVERIAALLVSQADADGFAGWTKFDGFCGLGVFADVILEMDFPRRQVSVLRHGRGRYPANAGWHWPNTR